MLQNVYRLWLIAAGLATAGAQTPALPEGPPTTFGVTVVDPFGLKGEIYLLPSDTYSLPKFEKLEPVGAVYTSALNIPPREFSDGFPGVTKRYEWFAIDYSGNFWIEKPGRYYFQLVSDDGSMLYIDGKRIIDNDGLHALRFETGSVMLKGGIHRIRVSYFQGPRFHLALILGVAFGNENFRVFSTDEFRPPRNPDEWTFGDVRDLPTDPNAGRRKLKDVIKKK